MPERHEVVISGIGGRFPECNSFEELRSKLFEKTNLVTTDDRRWPPGELGVPSALGKLTGKDHFDANFFGIHRKLCENKDPMTRLTIERAYEAIVDSGLNPTELNGTNTAVMMASCISETEYLTILRSRPNGFGILGHNRSMQANRISYILNLTGPSFAVDCSWIGGIQCLQQAFDMVADGHCTSALVGVVNLAIHPNISLQYIGIGKLSFDGQTKSFDAEADGYSRSEACVVFYLQRKQDAKRSYGTLVNISSTTLGERPGTYLQTPTSDSFKSFLEDSYRKAKVDPAALSYLEADGCGLPAIDAWELNVCDEVMCKNRKEPLLVGSIKSNVGHSEASSCLVSMVKALIALDMDMIPPNLSYSSPNPSISGLKENRLKVVTEVTPLEGDYVAVNSFSLTGSVAHIILKKNPKQKVKKELENKSSDDIPRLFIASARDEDGMNKVLDKAENSPFDEEFFYLVNDVFCKDLHGHLYRGFTILPKKEVSQKLSMEVGGGKQRPIWFIFSGMGSQWNGMGRSLMQFPIFAAAIQKCHNILKPKGVDVINIITSDDPTLFDNILNCFVGIAAVQIGLVDLLFALGIKPDGILGHSVGELGCAYADGCFSAEEMILCAHARGRASLETNLIKGMMAAVGMGYQQIKDELPDKIEVACHNAADSCTLSGPAEDMEIYIQQLKDRKIFAKLVNVANIAYHSRYIATAAPTLLNYLKEVIKEPKERSVKWISSSIPEEEWDMPLAKSSSPEYHTNNLLKPVLFEESCKHIKKDAICIEIAPHGLLQAILRGMSEKGCTNIPLTLRTQKDGVRFFLESVGKMYVNGLLPDVKKLYPSVELPTSRGTQPLSEFVTWDHSETWPIPGNANLNYVTPGMRTINIDLNNIKHHFFLNHRVNERWILPEAAYLYFAWESLMLLSKEFSFEKNVIFENIRFHEIAVIDEKTTLLEGNILLQIGSGNWEILIDDKITATGCIREVHDVYDTVEAEFPENQSIEFQETPKDVVFEKKDVYEILENVGFSLKRGFDCIERIVLNETGMKGTVLFSDNWTQFLDGLVKLATFGKIEAENRLLMPTAIKKLIVKPNKIQSGQAVDFVMNFNTNVISSPVMKVFGVESENITVKPLTDIRLRLEEYRFVSHFNSSVKEIDQVLDVGMQLVTENSYLPINDNNKLLFVVLDDKNRISHLLPKIEEAVDKRTNVQIKIVPATLSLDGLLQSETIKPSSLLILTAETSLKNALQVLEKHKGSFVMAIVSSQCDLIQKVDYKILYHQQMETESIVLLKKSVKPDMRSWSVIHTSNPSWSSELAILNSASPSNANHVIYLVTDEEQMAIPRFVKTVESSHPNCKQIRYFILLDNKCPKFTPNLLFFSEQVALDLKINVYKDGKWGSYRKFKITDDVVPELDTNSSFTALSTLSSDSIDLHYLGFNYKDFSVVHSDDIASELGHLDYSGANSKGGRIMGLSPHQTGMTKLSPDPILRWKIPTSWSFEEAASIPLAYTMAYYSLIEVARLTPQQKVLIHCGYTPIGLAAISIAVKNKCTIFTTYSSDEQAKLILSNFPSINNEHMFHENENFDININLITKGSGVDVILNLNEGEISSSLECLGHYGRFLHLGQNKKELKSSIGMVVFLKAISVFGVNGNSLFEYPDSMKVKLRNMVQSGIEDGTVKPLARTVTQGPCTDRDASELLRNSIGKHAWKKVQHCIKPEKSKKSVNSLVNKFTCNPNCSYILVGGETSLFLDVAAWLVGRGAKKLVVAINQKALNTVSNRRLNLLVSKHSDLVIQKIPAEQINSVKGAESIICNTISLGPVDGIFFAALKDKNGIISFMDKASRRLCPSLSIFLSLFSGGGNICDSRREAKLSGMALHCKKSNPYLEQVLYSLDSAMDKKNISQILLTEYSSDMTSDDDKTRHLTWHLPSSIDELLAFEKELTVHANFEEINTKSPRFSETKGTPPVFLIPGFKPDQLKKLTSKLVYPAFVARLPSEITSIHDVATDLIKELKKLRSAKFYTFIASGWGGLLALKMSSLLEAEGNLVTVMLIDAAPDALLNWTSFFKDDMNAKLINRFFTMTNEEQIEFSSSKDWDKCLSIMSNNFMKNIDNGERVKLALTALRNRIGLVDNKDLGVLKTSIIFSYKPFEVNVSSSLSNLKNLCKNIAVTISKKNDLQSMIDDEQFIQDINSHVQFEYPDSVLKPETIKTISSLVQEFSIRRSS